LETLYRHSETIHNFNAAREIVPLLLRLTHAQCVLDVGCGTGTWLKVFEENGVEDYCGVDGFYVNENQMKISVTKFVKMDLRTNWSLNRKFDLVICLEVAEHLPESSADVFIEDLTRHGDFIVFSAAVPGQGGQNHLNEQWPEYWQKKFNKHGFYFHDTLRPLIWSNERIEWWYRQNIFLVKKEKPIQLPFYSLSLVHPQLLELKNANEREYFESLVQGKQGIRVGFTIFFNSLRFKFKNIFRLKKNG
jgi:SAM-dependent methyltransferase